VVSPKAALASAAHAAEVLGWTVGSPTQVKVRSPKSVSVGLRRSGGHLVMPARGKVMVVPAFPAPPNLVQMTSGRFAPVRPVKMLLPTAPTPYGKNAARAVSLPSLIMPTGWKTTSVICDFTRSSMRPSVSDSTNHVSRLSSDLMPAFV
jgi:hypothetical protein